MRQEQCPVCHAKGQVGLLHLSIQKCEQCQVSWTLIQEDIDVDALYEDKVYAVVDNRKSIFERVIFSEAEKVIRTVTGIINKTNPIKCLDFGSGKGQFLLKAKEAGWQTLGLETAKERADFSREKYGLDVIEKYYHSGKIGEGEFDVISLNHVLEHLPHPIELLQELTEKNLKPGGILIVEVPNLHSWQSNIAGSKWMHLDIPKHLTHWHEQVLSQKITALGFDKIKSQYFSVHLGVLGMLSALLGNLGYKGNIIYDLKNRKNPGLLIGIALILPFSFLLETLAVPFKKTGILRLYFKKHESKR
ncbi:class I SAM-dependent methyltransferase [Fontibacter flavus]|uniref:Class I SAM-dependent methyltransferase n=1 Tax=Fontibacter flavus TaxID=654838 RepID=A0ABV6FRP4_9BACT